eukprot:m.23859 g.23859  ORF g.23859 m.23859 type:complete len:399 (+) comp6001_c0_seq2:171-1367(+)
MLKFFPVWGSIRLLGSRGKLRLCPAIRHSSEFRSLWWSAFQHPHSQLDQGSTPRRSSSAGGQRGKGLLFSLSTWSNKQAGRSRRVDKTLGIMWSVDGAVQESEVTAKEMLTSNPSGAYTTLRTVEHGTAVFQLDSHLDRLASSLDLIRGKEANGAPVAAVDRTKLNAKVLEVLRGGLQSFGKRHPVIEGSTRPDVRVTLLLVDSVRAADADSDGKSSPQQLPTVLLHATEMPPPASPPVVVEVRGSARSNAEAKDSAWVTDRMGLEAARRADTNEILLEDEDGRLVEGSQTNFFAVIDGAVHTAEEGILKGTVRDVVIKACADIGISIIFEPPKTDSYPTWDGAFITSTSRMVLPIDLLVLPLAELPAERTFPASADALPRQIADAVQRRVRAASTPL